MIANQQEEKEIFGQWWVAEAINDYESEYIGVSAGLGSGKTYGAVQLHLDRCALNHQSPYSAFMMPTYQKIHDSAIPKFKEILSSLGLFEGYHYKILKSPFPKLLLKMIDHEIHFISANNPETIVAVEYSHATVSEAGTTNREACERVIERVRHPLAVLHQKVFEGVPECGGFFQDTFDNEIDAAWEEILPRDYRKTVHTKYGDVKYRRFRLRTYDNEKFLPGSYLANLLATYEDRPNYLKAYIEGFFVPLHVGNVYSAYNPLVHDIEDIEPDPFKPIYLTWDFNVNPVTWIALQEKTFHEGYKRTQRFIVMDECSLDVQQLDQAVTVFAAKFPPSLYGNTPIEVYGDMSGHARSHKVPASDYDMIKKYLNKLGYRNVIINAARTNPPETTSVEALNSMFRQDVLYINKRCEKIRMSLIKTRWKDGVRKIDKPSGETWTHSGDALKYFAYAKNEDHRIVKGVNPV